MARAALEAVGLSKRFGALAAVRDLGLLVDEGSVYGFLGPNGAGKTTTIRMMLGLMAPDAGSVRIFGLDLRRDFKRAIRPVGAMVEGPAFYPFLSARANLRLFGRLSGGVPHARLDEVLELVGLARRGDDKLAGYSQGMRQRLGIALALLARPRLLVLDEPTNGLDPQGTREVRELLRHIRDVGGTTVFLSSHLLAEMEQLCDRVAVLASGRVLCEESLDALLGEEGAVVEVALPEAEAGRALGWLATEDGVRARLLRPGRLEVRAAVRDAAALNRALVERGFAIAEFSRRRRTLEEVFVELTGENAEIR